MKANRFDVFADEDAQAAEVKQVQQQVRKQQEKKTVVVVKQQVAQDDNEAFESVQQKGGQAQRGGQRGGRGNDRGGRGRDNRPREDRPQTAKGERGRGGERRGRGRGDRPQTAQPVAADGEQRAENKERRGRGGRGRSPRHHGKPREGDHPMDRQDGTGRGRRGDKKSGHGKGNWGADKPEKEQAAEQQQEEQKEERPARRERKEEPEEVYEEVGFTLDDYMAAKQAKSSGLLQTKEARQNEKVDAKNIQTINKDKAAEQATTKIYNKKDTIAVVGGSGVELMGFQATVDAGEMYEAKGKRRDRDERPRDNQTRGGRGGRRGGKIVVDDKDFPAIV